MAVSPWGPIWNPYRQMSPQGREFFEPRTTWASPTYQHWWPFPFPPPEVPAPAPAPAAAGGISPSDTGVDQGMIGQAAPGPRAGAAGDLGASMWAPAIGGLAGTAASQLLTPGGFGGGGGDGQRVIEPGIMRNEPVPGEWPPEPFQSDVESAFMAPFAKGAPDLTQALAGPFQSDVESEFLAPFRRAPGEPIDISMAARGGVPPDLAAQATGAVPGEGPAFASPFQSDIEGAFMAPSALSALEPGAFAGSASAAQGAVGPALEATNPWLNMARQIAPYAGAAAGAAGAAGRFAEGDTPGGIRELVGGGLSFASPVLGIPWAIGNIYRSLFGRGGLFGESGRPSAQERWEGGVISSQGDFNRAIQGARSLEDIANIYAGTTGTRYTPEQFGDPAFVQNLINQGGALLGPEGPAPEFGNMAAGNLVAALMRSGAPDWWTGAGGRYRAAEEAPRGEVYEPGVGYVPGPRGTTTVAEGAADLARRMLADPSILARFLASYGAGFDPAAQNPYAGMEVSGYGL